MKSLNGVRIIDYLQGNRVKLYLYIKINFIWIRCKCEELDF